MRFASERKVFNCVSEMYIRFPCRECDKYIKRKPSAVPRVRIHLR
jgi:hypothetical protein